MKRSGYADLPLHRGHVPSWLATRMTLLGTAIVEAVLYEYGRSEVLTRLSDPFWFQALGSVMGMDWHSSGITTSVMGALKRGLNPRAHALELVASCPSRQAFSHRPRWQGTGRMEAVPSEKCGSVHRSMWARNAPNRHVFWPAWSY